VNGYKVDEIALNDSDKIQFGTSTVMKFANQDSLETEFQMNLYESSVKDPLTNSFNKRYFQDRLQRELSFSIRHGSNIALLMIDIDFFKKVNDTYGHLAGDAVLKEISRKINHKLRNEDIFCRYGGEEFALIVRGCNYEQVVIIAERIRLLIANSPIEWNSTLISVSVSIGGALLGDCKTAEELVAVADKKLYEAKNGGRNCCRI